MVLLRSLRWGPTVSSLGIIQWDFTRRDHPRNMGRVSGSGPVTSSLLQFRGIIKVKLVFFRNLNGKSEK